MSIKLLRRAMLVTGTVLSAALTVPATAQQETESSVDYAEPRNWLCRPDNLRACDVDLNTTIVAASGSMRRENWEADPNAPIDCFYVYPTVSQDDSANSDMQAGSEEMDVVRSQFARMASECRPFAPLYRQVTLTALRANMSGDQSMTPDSALGYNDIRNAWNHYLENHNNGRGVVLVGHSQGSSVLTRLIREEIEGREVQDRIVSAMLIGTTVQVPRNEPVGATFEHMPLCQSASQTGCIITYASYREEIPPPQGALFGRASEDDNTVAACTNPAQLAKGSNELHAYLSNTEAEGFSSEGPVEWTTEGVVETPFVSVPGLLSAECVENGPFHYLQISVHDDPEDPRADRISGDVMGGGGEVNAAWGLHLIDMNLAMGDLIRIIDRQTEAYLDRQ